MFERGRIEEIAEKSKVEKWPYPKIFNALKAAGVEYYETSVSTHEIVYHGSGESWTEPAPKGFGTLQVSPEFDGAGVKEAILRNQRKETDYTGFLQGIAAAGCTHYRVDMNAREIAYMGHGEQYVEKVPDFKE
ncbi:MAG: DUF1398 family protein [Candidatus Dadabacteria bacterium]|nr:DUF1398 family protein [Candidatus Dadabacteria bacterium]